MIWLEPDNGSRLNRVWIKIEKWYEKTRRIEWVKKIFGEYQ